MQIPIQIEVSNGQVLGMLHVPEHTNNNTTTIIIMCYGLNGDRVDNHRLAVEMARHAEAIGFFFLRFDYRGCGISTGDFFEISIDSKIEDTLAIINLVEGAVHHNNFKLILFGYSDGARIVSEVIKANKNIHAVCLWNPVFDSITSCFSSKNKNSLKISREPETKKMVFPLFGLWLNSKHLRQINNDVGFGSIEEYQGSKLLVFGGNDVYTEKMRNNILKNSRNFESSSTIEIIEGANHLFNRIEWIDQLFNLTLNWLKKITS